MLLSIDSVIEGITGLALILLPNLVIWLLFGAELMPIATVMSRIAGMGILSLAVGCWVGRQERGGTSDFILKRRGARKVNLLGWSWGTIITAAYAGVHGDRVGSLVLHAPVWCTGSCEFDAGRVASLTAAHAKSGEMAAVVESSPVAARKRFQSGAPEDKLDTLMPPAWFEAWSAASLATDPVGASQNG